MAMIKKISGKHAHEVRSFLQLLAKNKLGPKTSLDEVAKEISLTRSGLESMLYRGEGGLDSWVELLSYLYGLKPQQIVSILTEVRENLRDKTKMTMGQVLMAKVSDNLTEDKRHFWAGIISAAENLQPPFSITRKNLKRKKKTNT